MSNHVEQAEISTTATEGVPIETSTAPEKSVENVTAETITTSTDDTSNAVPATTTKNDLSVTADTNESAPHVNENKDEEESASTEKESVMTVFHDNINFNVKHPLHNEWTLWFDNPGKKANSQSWSQNLKEIATVDSVEDFWGMYNNIVKVNHLDMSSNYHLFKKGVRPEWEDPANANGGKFSIQFPKNRTGEAINKFWLDTILNMIGEQFEFEHEICGAVVSVRKVFYRIALWVRSADKDNEYVETIGRQLKDFLNVPNNIAVEFTPHGEHGDSRGQRFTVA